MGFLKNIFGNASEDKNQDKEELSWISLTTESQMETIKENSKTKTQLVFKHSTSCGISSMVLKRFTNDFSLTENQIDLYYLDLLKYRNISNALADDYQLIHESPQVLIIKNGELVAYGSHSDVNTLDLEQFI